MKRFTLTILAAILIPLQLEAQTPVRLTLSDGTRIHCSTAAASIPVKTAFGDLVVPLAKIRRISVGVHATKAEAKDLHAGLRGLTSASYREREAAEASLVRLGRIAAPHLARIAETSGAKDAEIRQRAAKLLQKIREADARPIADHDEIATDRMVVIGSITAESIAVKSAILGDLVVPIGRVERVEFLGRLTARIDLDAVQYGSDLEKSYKTGIRLEAGESVEVSASGSVDLWPQTPGQYLADPKGHAGTTGRGGTFLAGALLAKVGSGPWKVIGSLGRVRADAAGEVRLQIVPNPWNAPSSGSFKIEVRPVR